MRNCGVPGGMGCPGDGLPRGWARYFGWVNERLGEEEEEEGCIIMYLYILGHEEFGGGNDGGFVGSGSSA